MNSDFRIFRELEIDIKNYGFLDNFSFEKRRKLIDIADSILFHLEKNTVTVEQAEYLKQLNIKLMTLAKGNKISNLFLKYIDKDHLRYYIKEPIFRIQMRAKKIDKLITAKVNPSQLRQILSSDMIDAVIFNQHLYERMMHFNHPFVFNHNQELMFKYTKMGL